MRKINNKQSEKKSLYKNALELITVGSVTGVFAGAVVTLYNFCTKQGEALSRGAAALLGAIGRCRHALADYPERL